MSNVSVDVNWINGVSLEKHCDQSNGRATYYLKFETQYEPGDFYPLENVSFSLTPNAAAVSKFERIAAAINTIMADKDGWLDMSTAPEDGTEILVCVRQHNRPDGKIVQAVVWFENGDWRLDDDEKGRAHPPLCWRRLPAPRASDAAPVAMPDAAE